MEIYKQENQATILSHDDPLNENVFSIKASYVMLCKSRLILRVLQGMIWYILHIHAWNSFMIVSVCNLLSVWYGYDVKKLRIAIMLKI